MTDPTPLSDAAEAVLDAYESHIDKYKALGAVLRAAAKQVRNWDAKEQLLTIATELEGAE